MKIMQILLFSIVLSLASGCASFVMPTPYLAYHRLPNNRIPTNEFVQLYWADKTVSLSPYKNIVVKPFSSLKTVGTTPLVNPVVYSSKLHKHIIADLKQEGKNAATTPSSFSKDIPYLVIEGNIAQLNPGNKRLRAWLPGEAGRAILEVEVQISRVERGTHIMCAEFTSTDTKASGRWGGEDAELLDICTKEVAKRIARFMATHRNR